MRPLHSGRRAGFTLVEMLVVMAIILVIATTFVAIAPGLRSEQRITNASERLQGLFLPVKQQAFRDQKLRGLRLIQNTTVDTSFVTELQYVEQPDPITGTVATVVDPTGGPPNHTILQIDQDVATVPPSPGARAAVEPGDFITIDGESGPGVPKCGHRIESVTLAVANKTNLTLYVIPGNETAMDASFAGPASGYRIVRGMRPTLGEPTIQMPAGMAILLPNTAGALLTTSDNVQVGSRPETFFARTAPQINVVPIDIIFGATGQVANIPDGKIVLWLIDISDLPNAAAISALPYEKVAARSTLMTIFTRTGLVSAQPVGPFTGAGPLTDPYVHTKTPRSGGF